MSSPGPYMPQSRGNNQCDTTEEVSSRPMRVKILYSFDANHATNCLARLPDAFQIPAILSDEGIPIGVIELQQCIGAIITASPEIASGLDSGDYTIYAHDYSEPDSPLVGQGMLSNLLAGEEAGKQTANDASPALVTGRVVRNTMGLFTKGIAETLEVKIRLVHIVKASHGSFSKSLDQQRRSSPALGLEHGGWNGQFNTANNIISNLEMQSQNQAGQRQSSNVQHQRRASVASIGARPSSAMQNRNRVSRPSSRASLHNGQATGHSLARSDSYMSIVEDQQEEGPARKRVKVTQTDWHGKSHFGGSADSLRVTASTAASIRVHKPVPTRPGLHVLQSLEPPPRAPTPVPQVQSLAYSRAKGQVDSLSRRASSLQQPQMQKLVFDNQSEHAMSSPEDARVDDAEDSPLNIPSSPPQMPTPSSPGLPPIAILDSGYMSGGVNDDPQSDLQGYKEVPQRSSYRRERDPFIGETPGPPELLPTRMNTTVRQGKHRVPVDFADRRSSVHLPPRPSLLSTESTASLEIGQTQNNDEIIVDGQVGMKVPSRSAAASPAPSTSMPFGGKPRSGSGAKRKKAIQSKLLQSLANGSMPTYCYNCGAIETPTWRTLYIKIVNGAPDDSSLEPVEGETRGVEVLERDETTSSVTKYRIVKSIRKKKTADASVSDFTAIQVCNPCGLWFNKFTYMRPPQQWVKKSSRTNTRKNNLESDMLEPPSDFPHSDMPQSGFWTDQIIPEDTLMPDEDSADADTYQVARSGSEDQREGSAEERPVSQASNKECADIVAQCPTSQGTTGHGLHVKTSISQGPRSSPSETVGSKHSPIVVDDLTPKPTRRLLFPSPRAQGQIKSLEDSSTSLSTPKKDESRDGAKSDVYVGLSLSANKENFPSMSFEDDFASFFDMHDAGALFKTPSKSATKASVTSTPPSKSLATFDALLQTPTPIKLNATLTRTPNRSMDAFLPSFSSAEKRELLGTPSRYMALTTISPSSSLINRGDKARSVSGEMLPPMTPFTRHLSQLFDDPNMGALNGGNKAGSNEEHHAGDVHGLGDLFSPATLAFARGVTGLSTQSTRYGAGVSPMKAMDFDIHVDAAGNADKAATGLGIENGASQRDSSATTAIKVEVVVD